jgi:deoxyadenosine/deoxycytidine kinase
MINSSFLIGVVGPCGAGKSTLVINLRKNGYNAKAIAQEHSFVPEMWQKFTKPNFLIYLSASYKTTIKRKKFAWTIEEYSEQLRRLNHALINANLIIQTDELTIDDVKLLAEKKLSEYRLSEIE